MYTFREKNDSQCICDDAIHGHFKFGDHNFTFVIDEYCDDNLAIIHKYAFENNFFENCDKYLIKDKTNSYFVECFCSHCKISSNIINDNHELCFCCKVKIYTPNERILKCEDCDSVLCNKCVIRGKYEECFYCFDCRRFSIHKNSRYYFSDNKYKFDECGDWQDASWYY